MGETIKLKYRFHIQKVGHQYLAITTGEEVKPYPQVLEFNVTGAEIIRLLLKHTFDVPGSDNNSEASSGVTFSTILDELCDIYDASREELSQCLDEVLKILREAGTLVETL